MRKQQEIKGKKKRTKLTMVAKLFIKNGDVYFRGIITDVSTGHTISLNNEKSLDEAVREIVAMGRTARRREPGP